MISKKAILLNTEHLNVLVVGAGKIGSRKIERYLKSGAKVYAIDPSVCRCDAEHFKMSFDTFIETHLDVFLKMHLIVITTSDQNVNQKVALLCDTYGKLYNRTDAHENSLFSDMQSVPLANAFVAVSGGGHSPYVSQYLQKTIGDFLDENHVKNRLNLLATATPNLKKNRVKGSDLFALDDETLERIYIYEDH